jgi:hypothetical protein
MVRGVHWQNRMVSGVPKVRIALPSLLLNGMVRGVHWQSRMVSGVPKVRIELPFSQPSLVWDGEGSSLAE